MYALADQITDLVPTTSKLTGCRPHYHTYSTSIITIPRRCLTAVKRHIGEISRRSHLFTYTASSSRAASRSTVGHASAHVTNKRRATPTYLGTRAATYAQWLAQRTVRREQRWSTSTQPTTARSQPGACVLPSCRVLDN